MDAAERSTQPEPIAQDAGAGRRWPYWLLRLGARFDAPGIYVALGRAGVRDDERWRSAPQRETRGLWHGYRMRLDLSDHHQRGAYFYGRLLDLSVQAFMMLALEPGDDCIDLGANIGLLTLAAARAVGPKGRVLAVEPNPDVFARLEWHVEANGLHWVRALCAAASDREATMTLSVPPTRNTGAGTLGRLLPRHGDRVSARHEVRLFSTDALVEQAWGPDGVTGRGGGRLLVKIDVEGHETAALRGLRRTIEARWPVVLAEVNAYMLGTNGSSAGELMGLMRDWGYRPYRMTAWREGLLRRARISLTTPPEGWPEGRTVNVVFLRNSHASAAHLARLLSA